MLLHLGLPSRGYLNISIMQYIGIDMMPQLLLLHSLLMDFYRRFSLRFTLKLFPDLQILEIVPWARVRRVIYVHVPAHK